MNESLLLDRQLCFRLYSASGSHNGKDYGSLFQLVREVMKSAIKIKIMSFDALFLVFRFFFPIL